MIGFLGDLYNAIAAVWLAYDLLFKEREAEKKEMWVEVQKGVGDRLPLAVDGIRLTGRSDLERVFILRERDLTRRAALGARSACLLLGLGLVLVLATRILEFFEQGHIEILWRTIKHIPF